MRGALALLATAAAAAFLAGGPPTSGAMATYAVGVAGHLGKGEFVLFGDDAIFQNQFLRGNNRKLAENLAGWLVEEKRAAAN